MRYADSAAPVAAPGFSLFETLEKREFLTAVVNPAAIKTRNVSANGVSTNQSVLTVPFSEKVNIADVTKIQVRGFAIDTINGGQKKIVINVVDAQVIDVGQDYGLIQITTDRLMRKGGAIFFYAGALTHQADGTAVPEQLNARALQGQNKERFTLACRAWKPTDINLLSPSIYTGASAPTVADSVLADAAVEAELTTFLETKRLNGLITAAQRDEALALYDDATNRLRVPDHNMRAALVSLTGTFAANAINVYLGNANVTGKPYTIVAFAETSESAVIAQTRVTSANRLETRIKPTFQGEHFAALSAILAHEAVHQDNTFTIQEESVANVMQDVVYAQQVDTDPTIVNDGTSLVKYLNTQQLALLNSGRALFPITGVLQGPILQANRGVFPGGKVVPGGNYVSYNNYVFRQYEARGGVNGTSPGNPTMDEYLTHFTGDAPAGAFSDTLITRLDANLWPVLTNPMAVRIATALKLTV
jgi:hypothetical protein